MWIKGIRQGQLSVEKNKPFVSFNTYASSDELNQKEGEELSKRYHTHQDGPEV